MPLLAEDGGCHMKGRMPVRKWGPQSCNCKEFRALNNLNELGNRFFPRNSIKKTQPCYIANLGFSLERSRSRELSHAHPDLCELINCEVINECCFKALKFVVICYASVKK